MADFKKRLMEELMKGTMPPLQQAPQQLQGMDLLGVPQAPPPPVAEPEIVDDEEIAAPVPKVPAKLLDEPSEEDSKEFADSDQEKMDQDEFEGKDDSKALGQELADSGNELDKKVEIDENGNPIEAGPASVPEQTAAPSKEIPKEGSPGYYSDLMNRFKAAQERSNTNRSLNDVSRGADIFTSGMRGVQRSPQFEKMIDEKDKRADLPVQQFMQQLQVEGMDPNSQAAGTMRAALASTLGIEPTKLANMSPTQMEALAKSMGTITHSQVMAKVAALNSQTNLTKAITGKQVADQGAQKIASQAPLIAANIEKSKAQTKYLGLKPGLEQQKIDILQSKSEKSLLEKGNKADKDLANDVNNFKGNTGVQKANEALRNSESAMQIIKKYPDLNKMNPQDYNFLIAELGKIATGGATTVATMHDLRVKTLQSRAAEFMQAVENEPTGAQLGEFIQGNKEYLEGLNSINRKFVDDYREDKLLGAKGASPEFKQFLTNKHLPGRDLDFENFSSKPKQESTKSNDKPKSKKPDWAL